MDAFPAITDLANAPEERVLRLWQGLGYYSRARNLHSTAKFVAEDLKGKFPNTYAEIIKLKGVGPYTAAAIASICFNETEPVVDGNVFRFASRYFGIKEDISKGSSRKVFENVLKKEIPSTDPGTFNQAMMEFGATTCAPSFKCGECDFSVTCFAFQNDEQRMLPIKTGKTKVRDRHFNYIVFQKGDRFLLKERTEKDVWSGLFDFHLIEGKGDEEEILKKVIELPIDKPIIEEISEPILHILSHQKITARFYQIKVSEKDVEEISQKTTLKSFSVEEILNLPKPKLIVNYLTRLGIK